MQNNSRISTEEITERPNIDKSIAFQYLKNIEYFEARYMDVNRSEQIESNFCSCFFAWSTK